MNQLTKIIYLFIFPANTEAGPPVLPAVHEGGEAKLQVDLVCDENDSCSVTFSRLDWYEATSQCIPAELKDKIKELCICSQ